MNLTIKDLTGTWRSKIDEDHYFDLTFRENGTYLFDEINEGKRIAKSSIISTYSLTVNEEIGLLLENLDYSLFMCNFEQRQLVFKDLDGDIIEFNKIS